MRVLLFVLSVLNVYAELTKCDLSNFDLAKAKVKKNALTNRGIEDHHLSVVDTLRTLPPDFSALEIGTGSGHTLMDIQAKYPHARLVGTNYARNDWYGIQASNSNDLLATARYFNISVWCRAPNEPVLPKIVEIQGVETAEYVKKLNYERFRLIFSLHALNKPETEVMHEVIYNIISLMDKNELLAVLYIADVGFKENGASKKYCGIEPDFKETVLFYRNYKTSEGTIHLWVWVAQTTGTWCSVMVGIARGPLPVRFRMLPSMSTPGMHLQLLGSTHWIHAKVVQWKNNPDILIGSKTALADSVSPAATA
eukprot:gb/GEZN01009507.1/.p1 GENE.gb/GEZN01009507.1/~~gb/GEZN01009507.1/.p1  ORF type:complete len:310 (+),score=7.80 gb/GEZN01009507.1/:80-1009(+)